MKTPVHFWWFAELIPNSHYDWKIARYTILALKYEWIWVKNLMINSFRAESASPDPSISILCKWLKYVFGLVCKDIFRWIFSTEMFCKVHRFTCAWASSWYDIFSNGRKKVFWLIFVLETRRLDVKSPKLEQIETTSVFQLQHLLYKIFVKTLQTTLLACLWLQKVLPEKWVKLNWPQKLRSERMLTFILFKERKYHLNDNKKLIKPWQFQTH